MLSDRLRRSWKIGATAAFGLFVFFLVFVLTLPYGRMKDYLVALVAQQGYDIEVKSAGPALGLGIRLKDVIVASRPSGAAKPTRIAIPVAKVRWSLLGALAGRRTYQVSANIFGGDLGVETSRSKTASWLDISATAIDLSEIPWVKAATNLPLSGRLELHLDEKMPGLRASATVGSLTWRCSACAVGDGKAKLIIPSDPILAQGLGLPKIRLGDLPGRISIDKGVGRLQGVQSKSPDGEFYVEGELKLSDSIASSYLDLYVRFKLSDTLLKGSEKLRTLLEFAGEKGKRPDGFYGFRVRGPLNHMGKPEWTKTSPFGAPASGPKPIAARSGAPKSGAALSSPPPTPASAVAQPAASAEPPTPSAPAANPPGFDPKIDNPPAEEPAPAPPPPPGAPPVIQSPEQEPPSMRVTDQAPPPAPAPAPGPSQPPAPPATQPAPPPPPPAAEPTPLPARGPTPPATSDPASSAPKPSGE